jgi:hypothetical protein
MNVTVEHVDTDGEVVTKTYEEVKSIVNPPPVPHGVLKLEDGDSEKFEGEIVKVT